MVIKGDRLVDFIRSCFSDESGYQVLFTAEDAQKILPKNHGPNVKAFEEKVEQIEKDLIKTLKTVRKMTKQENWKE